MTTLTVWCEDIESEDDARWYPADLSAYEERYEKRDDLTASHYAAQRHIKQVWEATMGGDNFIVCVLHEQDTYGQRLLERVTIQIFVEAHYRMCSNVRTEQRLPEP